MLNFAQPAWLFGLLLLPLLGLIHWQRVQRERRAMEAFAREPLLEKMAVGARPEARLVRGFLIMGAIACGLLALSQPRWGLSGDEALMAKAGSAVVAIDVSKSMLARDMGADSRLIATQRLVGELLHGLAGWKVGLVAFAGDGVPMVPLTTDHAAVATLLERARPGAAPGVGSNLEAGLAASLALYTQPGKRVLVLISDGEAHKGNPGKLIGKLRDEKVELIVIGMGTANGAPVPGAPDLWGNPTYMTYRGERVISRLDERSLKRLAADAGGTYVHAASPGAAVQLAAKLSRPKLALERAAKADQGFELFQVPLALMIVLMLAEAGSSLIGRPRREVRFADHVRMALGQEGRRGAIAGLLGKLRRPAVGLLLVAVATSQTAWTWYPSWMPNREAAKAYEAGDYGRARELLDGAVKADPENFRLHYNLGNAHYQQGNYAAAANVYRRAYELAAEEERPAIDYNLGNAAFRLAETTGNAKGYETAIQHYERVLAARPDDADAKHNLAVAKARLKQEQQKPGSGGRDKQGGSQGGQRGNMGPVGARTPQQPLPEIKNLPSQAEVDALLKALENDERQRQAESAEAQGQDPLDPALGQNLLQQALGQLDLQKDW